MFGLLTEVGIITAVGRSGAESSYRGNFSYLREGQGQGQGQGQGDGEGQGEGGSVLG